MIASESRLRGGEEGGGKDRWTTALIFCSTETKRLKAKGEMHGLP